MKFSKAITIDSLATWVNASKIIGDRTIQATGINEIHKVEKGDITFVDVEKYFQKALSSTASVILINQVVEAPKNKVLLVCENPFEVYNRIIKKNRPFRPLDSTVHPSAYIHPSAIIEPNVTIGPNVRIGKNSYIQSQVVIREYAKIGDYVTIQSGTVIGSDAFYFQKKEDGFQKWTSGGEVIIENQVDIGPNCTICKGVSGSTVIGEGSKLDGQVHIGHGVVIGKHCLLAAQVGIGGKTTIGNEVTIYGQVGIAPRLAIADKVVILAKSGVSKNLKAETTYFGYPAREVSLQYKALAALRLLPDLMKKMKLSLLLCTLLISVFSCQPTEVKLTRADKKAIDTLTTNQLKLERILQDSLCDLRRDSIIQKAVDSILITRKQQEERLREAY